MAQRFNIIVDKGSYFEAFVEIRDNDNNLIDLSNYTFFSGIRYNFTSEKVLEFNLSSNSLGVLTFVLFSNDTLNIKPENYVYDIYINDGTEYYRILEGTMKVTQKVTDYGPD